MRLLPRSRSHLTLSGVAGVLRACSVGDPWGIRHPRSRTEREGRGRRSMPADLDESRRPWALRDQEDVIRRTTDQKVRGSNPFGRTIQVWGRSQDRPHIFYAFCGEFSLSASTSIPPNRASHQRLVAVDETPAGSRDIVGSWSVNTFSL